MRNSKSNNLPESANSTALTQDLHDDDRNLLTDFMSITQLPTSAERIAKLRCELDLRLAFDFMSKLSDAERPSVHNSGQDVKSMYGKWDSYICFEAAPRYGARLLLSDTVMQRVWSWQCGEEDGTRKLQNLFREINHSADIGLKQAKGRVTASYRDRKRDFVDELRELQIIVRVEWPESAADVRKLVADTIEASVGKFRYLVTNRASLLSMLRDDRTAMRFRGESSERAKGDLTPVRFYELWVASTTRRTPESVRQDLSKL